MRLIHRLCLICVFCTVGLSAPLYAKTNSGQQHELVFGVLPFLSPVVLLKRFTPLKDYLEQVCGKKIYLESAPNFEEFAKRTKHQQYDIIFTAPHFVPMALDGDKYEIAAASKKLAAHIMVAENSPLVSISQLAGKRIAIGPKHAFVVFIAKYMLRNAGLSGKTSPLYKTYKSHNAALRTLEYKDADAAVIGSYLLDKAKKQGYRELGATPYYPGAAFLVSTRLTKEMREKISNAFINMPNSAEGRKTLVSIKFPGFLKISPDKYTPLRKIVSTMHDTGLSVKVHQ